MLAGGAGHGCEVRVIAAARAFALGMMSDAPPRAPHPLPSLGPPVREGGLRVVVAANHALCESDWVIPGCGRAAAWDAAHSWAAQSAQADFAIFQRRIHSLPRADGTLPNQTLKGIIRSRGGRRVTGSDSRRASFAGRKGRGELPPADAEVLPILPAISQPPAPLPQTARGFNRSIGCALRSVRQEPVRAGGHRVFPAANSFAGERSRGRASARRRTGAPDSPGNLPAPSRPAHARRTGLRLQKTDASSSTFLSRETGLKPVQASRQPAVRVDHHQTSAIRKCRHGNVLRRKRNGAEGETALRLPVVRKSLARGGLEPGRQLGTDSAFPGARRPAPTGEPNRVPPQRGGKSWVFCG
jgi:hypothetical protein